MMYPERFRKEHPLLTLGYFEIPFETRVLKVLASCDAGEDGVWEHVSVSLKNRNPNWNEMCYVKNLFWGEDAMCIQFHPRKKEYVNIFEYCLHIRKPPFEFENKLDGLPKMKL